MFFPDSSLEKNRAAGFLRRPLTVSVGRRARSCWIPSGAAPVQSSRREKFDCPAPPTRIHLARPRSREFTMNDNFWKVGCARVGAEATLHGLGNRRHNDWLRPRLPTASRPAVSMRTKRLRASHLRRSRDPSFGGAVSRCERAVHPSTRFCDSPHHKISACRSTGGCKSIEVSHPFPTCAQNPAPRSRRLEFRTLAADHAAFRGCVFHRATDLTSTTAIRDRRTSRCLAGIFSPDRVPVPAPRWSLRPTTSSRSCGRLHWHPVRSGSTSHRSTIPSGQTLRPSRTVERSTIPGVAAIVVESRRPTPIDELRSMRCRASRP